MGKGIKVGHQLPGMKKISLQQYYHCACRGFDDKLVESSSGLSHPVSLARSGVSAYNSLRPTAPLFVLEDRNSKHHVPERWAIYNPEPRLLPYLRELI